MNIIDLICVLLYLISTTITGVTVKEISAPRFKQEARLNHYTYLGSSVKFKCLSIGQPIPKVHWYRNGVYLNYSYMHTAKRYKENEQDMELEIKDVELGDKGEWRCLVWNNEGSIMRNFSLHIIDYCDYFLNSNHTAQQVPLECVCQWKMLNVFRQGVDFTTITDDICDKFKKDNENVILHRRSECVKGPCKHTITYEKIFFNPDSKKTLLYKDVGNLNNPSDNTIDNVDTQPSNTFVREELRGVPKIATGPKILGFTDLEIYFPGLNPPSDIKYFSDKLINWDINSEFDAKLQDMREIMKNRPSVMKSNNSTESETEIDESFDDVQIDIDGKNVDMNKKIETTIEPIKEGNFILENAENITEFPPLNMIETTTRSGYWPGPKLTENIAPYFIQVVYHDTEPIIAPSGRTIKLSCRARGIPQPHIIWYKENKELQVDTDRYASTKYHFDGYNLEMEDAVETDSGHYTCEVYNKHGTIKREFEVRIVDRTRSKPIIVPNVLLNQTVDVNSTVNFTCKVISDNLPHFTWAKLLKINGSYINYTIPGKPQFNLIDVQYLPRVRIFRDARRTVLNIINVTLADQGIYSCIIGNSLGIVMANGTLTVNEFKPKTLPTDPIPPPKDYYFILFVGLIFLTLAILIAAMTYVIYQRRQPKNRVQNLDDIGVMKKVVITKRAPKDGEIWPDLASSYAITIEAVVSKHEIGNSMQYGVNKGYEVPTDSDWEIDRKRIEIQSKLGEGAFGEVWQAAYKLGENGSHMMPVAVKKLKENAGDKELIILVGEMQIFKSIGEHKNVLKLIGCCTGIGDLYVVLELCPYGNLRSFLQSHRPLDAKNEPDMFTESINYTQTQPNISNIQEQNSSGSRTKRLMLRDLIRFAAEIARGMEFLASKSIIHRDLAARNVLVAENYVMKISDFGLSRNVLNNDYYRKHGNGNLPIKWMAPESLDEDNHIYTTMSDVWSYGVIVWEIMTLGEQPYRNIPMGALYEWLMEGNRMDPPPTCPVEIHEIMKKCWQKVPERRPTFKNIAEDLEALLNSDNKYRNELPSDASIYPSDTEDEGKGLIYLNSMNQPNPKTYKTSVATFDDFMNNQEYQNIDNAGEDAPLLEKTKPDVPKKRIKINEPFYFNVNNPNNRPDSYLDSHDLDSDAPISETSRRSSDATRQNYIKHDYVNDHKSGELINNANIIRSSHLSDSSAFDLELGNLIYSSPPSKKSSVSNLSNQINQQQIQLSRSSSKNGFSQRSYSTESQASSGRGGSSAMSSAEGIGGLADLCQVEYVVINAPENKDKDNPRNKNNH